jgi:hypothetical protein
VEILILYFFIAVFGERPGNYWRGLAVTEERPDSY